MWLKIILKNIRRVSKIYHKPRTYLLLLLFAIVWIYYTLRDEELNEDFDLIVRNAENNLKEQLKFDKGTGCKIPQLNPFSKEATQYDEDPPKITCNSKDWVKCYLSECRVINEILDTFSDVMCTYKDIIYLNDFSYIYSDAKEIRDNGTYHLKRSDHAKVMCSGRRKGVFSFVPSRWLGNVAGFRSEVNRKIPPKGREKTINIMMFGFDSTARIGFIRRMPRSYNYLSYVLNATVLKSYNIVGEGTKGALFPMLTGKNMYELPNTRVMEGNTRTCDVYPLLFYKLRDDGYRTAFFEDRPEIGAFQYWVNGFRHQPTDHYLRAFFQDRSMFGNKYCVGDTPQYKLMMNLTNQFMHLDGKKFIFTFVVDITHEDFNVITTADDDFLEFLIRFNKEGHLKDTLLVVMSDHGPKYAQIRNTPQGRLEERLPFMSFVLPEKLKTERPNALLALQRNVDTLTTPYDIHKTLLDAVGLKEYWNNYIVPGADIPRGMNLLEPIPATRSCSEAGIEPHWCLCAQWEHVTEDDTLYFRASDALLNFINGLTEPVRSKCFKRTLTNISWVKQYATNSQMVTKKIYQVKVTLNPGAGDFEATMTYWVETDKFEVHLTDISRTNKYGNQPSCILKTHAYLSPYCYCR
ncbi:uncharacterized protein LOC128681114 isoform X2 [Plodia interpunctella]|uniref:uncharacterized protein LOC128681114 isoform X2 n=1 Tax=Plodia interpunctella TaxID=58824 RepID=UPI0023677D1B|nr:uncharacterized protein LOC128681114 isoform X2 [Plodia interpunctella]